MIVAVVQGPSGGGGGKRPTDRGFRGGESRSGGAGSKFGRKEAQRKKHDMMDSHMFGSRTVG